MTSLFRRSQHGRLTAPVPLISTGSTCAMRGCSNETAQPCAYRDHRGRSCQTAFCPTHSVAYAGRSYCRRHAGTVQACAGPVTGLNGLPDVDDRAPSLVNWVARDLDKNIRILLTDATRSGESVVVEDTVRFVRVHTRNAHWERSWRIVAHTGLILKVTVLVAEDNDALVYVRVGTETVATAVPPWIVRPADGDGVAVAINISQRERFYRLLEENISAAVTRFRTREDGLSRASNRSETTTPGPRRGDAE